MKNKLENNISSQEIELLIPENEGFTTSSKTHYFNPKDPLEVNEFHNHSI